MDDIDNLSDISGLSEISDNSNITDIILDEETDILEDSIKKKENSILNLEFISKKRGYLDNLLLEETEKEEENVDSEEEEENEGELINELSKMEDLDEINISNIRNFVKENLVDYTFIEQDDLSIFLELKKDTNIIIICLNEGAYQRVKFISFDKKDRSILVRSKKLRCIIGLDENYVYCYKNDKMGQREVMELLLKAIESGEIIINKRDKTDSTSERAIKNIKKDMRVENILNDVKDKSVKIDLGNEAESRKVYIEYASNIGEKQLLLEIDKK